jgi:ketosteroid isomerase-like protein
VSVCTASEHLERTLRCPNPTRETRSLIHSVYRDFNARDVGAVLERMAADVEWPNAWEGGYVHGHAAVRDYWFRQWGATRPTVTPVDVQTLSDGRVDVTVHQVVRDRHGSLLSDSTVHHVYRLDRGQIVHMEIIE